MTAAIRNVEGSHLTATDKRNIRAIMAHDGFAFGAPFKVNGRKTYRVDRGDGGRVTVSIESVEVDGYGRRLPRVYRSSFDYPTTSEVQ